MCTEYYYLSQASQRLIKLIVYILWQVWRMPLYTNTVPIASLVMHLFWLFPLGKNLSFIWSGGNLCLSSLCWRSVKSQVCNKWFWLLITLLLLLQLWVTSTESLSLILNHQHIRRNQHVLQNIMNFVTKIKWAPWRTDTVMQLILRYRSREENKFILLVSTTQQSCEIVDNFDRQCWGTIESGITVAIILDSGKVVWIFIAVSFPDSLKFDCEMNHKCLNVLLSKYSKLYVVDHQDCNYNHHGNQYCWILILVSCINPSSPPEILPRPRVLHDQTLSNSSGCVPSKKC